LPIVIACSAPVFGTISPSRSAIASHASATPSGESASPVSSVPGAEDDVARRVLADQIQRAGRDLFGSEGFEGGGGEQILGHARAGGRGNGVDADVVLRALDPQCLGEAGEA
jgi:hypothetical protein